ncbi:hypothetical protein [Yeosuana marina]|uniref:hypothetical protein n=1 Tax=Yeosuana marina TaxID=1565536 RepID=UPI00141F1F0D|nr:hypothetical protein [Yeosuana marina]
MKQYIYVLLLLFSVTLNNCSLNSTNDTNTSQIIKSSWNLVNISGGFAGVNENFNTGEIVWSFNEDNSILTVTNTNTSGSIEYGPISGTYSFSVTNNGSNLFLFIDSNEFGSFTVTQNQLIIDQSMTTNGSAVDKFIYIFQRSSIIE